MPRKFLMQQMLTAAALVAGIGFATAIETGFRPDARVVSEVAGGLISGIILGSNVWQSVPVPTDVESRVMASGYAPASPPLADGYWAVAE